MFWDKVKKSDPEECWPWTLSLSTKGYGRAWNPETKRFHQAHRLAYELTHGKISNPKLDVCHKCDNRPCCNPAHLFLGTRKENMQDAKNKGRTRNKPLPGEMHGNAKLTDELVIKIREWANLGIEGEKIAKNFGVAAAHISRIIYGEAWGHIKEGIIPKPIKQIRAPAKHLSEEEKQTAISLCSAGVSQTSVGLQLGVDPSCISRLVKSHAKPQ